MVVVVVVVVVIVVVDVMKMVYMVCYVGTSYVESDLTFGQMSYHKSCINENFVTALAHRAAHVYAVDDV